MTTIKAYKYLAGVYSGDFPHGSAAVIPEIFIPAQTLTGNIGICFNFSGAVFELQEPRNFKSCYHNEKTEENRTELEEVEIPLHIVEQAYRLVSMKRQLKQIQTDFAPILEGQIKELKLDDMIVNHTLAKIRKAGNYWDEFTQWNYHMNGYPPTLMDHPLGDQRRSLVLYPDNTEKIVNNYDELHQVRAEFNEYYKQNRETLDLVYNQYFIERVKQGNVHHDNFKKDPNTKAYRLPDGKNVLVIFPDGKEEILPFVPSELTFNNTV